MAIIGNIYKLEKILKDKELYVIFEYFKQALNINNKVHKRILASPIGSFEKVNITNDIFALEQVFYTKNREDCFIESHKRYIDFQLILSGNEQMEYVDIDKLEIVEEYNKEKDLIIYKLVDNTSKFLLQENDLAIFFPDDGHIGLPKFKESELVYKTVIKLPIEIWEKS
jgi:YhcH/YjgK/YiaL family protein